MMCSKCGMLYNDCKCNITAAAHHAVMRDFHLQQARGGEVAFKESWTKYRDGQRAMLNTAVTWLHTHGYQTLAEEMKEALK